ncbi:calpain-A [Aplysia californica]|uniref:Calpain-A n=1 Tax=Aplysia californica TaxID=6500 RepID=A0ABM1VYW1_APLCA|nr:calpain-A [Aplysia californica]
MHTSLAYVFDTGMGNLPLAMADIANGHGQKPVFSKGISRFDVRQGNLGDCWFVAAVACLCSRQKYRPLFERVVDPDQSFQDDWYSGIFRFNFWRFGQWKQIIIDDLLPTVRGNLIYANSPQSNEFWPALLEKAYAKVHGSYEAIEGGLLLDSLTDLTGGLTESYMLHGPEADVPDDIVNLILKAIERQSIIGCNIMNSGRGIEALRANGLLEGHAYSLTSLRKVKHRQNQVTLVKVRNPHGDHKEWNGRWNERSQEWLQISPSEREQLVVSRPDGEFWMDFEDFKEQFDHVVICNLSPDSPVDFERKWFSVEHHGRWTRHFNAGGNPSSPTHWSNPQYILKLDDADDDYNNVCSLVIQLMQVDRRKIKRKGINSRLLYIGFNVYKYERGYSVPLGRDFFQTHWSVATSGHNQYRQCTKRLTLVPGEYVVVPSTWAAEEEGDFFLRLFFEKGNVAEYLDQTSEVPKILVPTPVPEWKEQEETFKKVFQKISGRNMEVNPFELMEALKEELRNEPLQQDVSIGTCKSFVNLMDVDRKDMLSFKEFQNLWHQLRIWKETFYKFDIDRSGSLDSRELRSALNDAVN